MYPLSIAAARFSHSRHPGSGLDYQMDAAISCVLLAVLTAASWLWLRATGIQKWAGDNFILRAARLSLYTPSPPRFWISFISEGLPLRSKFSVDNIPDLSNQVMMVTGGNRGVGFEIVKVRTEPSISGAHWIRKLNMWVRIGAAYSQCQSLHGGEKLGSRDDRHRAAESDYRTRGFIHQDRPVGSKVCQGCRRRIPQVRIRVSHGIYTV